MASRSPKYLLIEERLGQSLASYLQDRKADGDSLEKIARKIWAETNVDVTAMTVSNWLATADDTAGAA